MKISNAPARYEGDHCHLGALIRREARSHLSIATEVGQADPEIAPQMKDNPYPVRLCNVETGIWQMLTTGWARVLEDWSGMVFWHPVEQEFQPWSAELNRVLVEIVDQVRPVVDAEVSVLPPVRKPPIVVLTDTDKLVH